MSFIRSAKGLRRQKGVFAAVCCLGILLGCMNTLPAAAAKTNYEKRAQEILKTMTWKEKIAQMFVVAVPKSRADTIQKKYQFGGYVFFRDDFSTRTPKQAKALIQKIQKASKVKALIAVDEEGGTVTRVSGLPGYRSQRFASPRELYVSGGFSKIKKDTREKASLLKKLGVNTNLAPVADVPYRSSNFIYKRSFSTNASSVSKYIKTVVKEMGKKNLVSTLKHFPGYGGNGDTHTLVIRDTRSKSTFEKRDLKPFAAGIRAGCDMIMVSHNVVNCFDRSLPASLSKKVHRYLRKTMGFDGVIITDDICMTGAASFVGGSAKAAVKAVQAGNDMICTTSYKTQYEAVVKAFRQGEISRSQINASVKRILIMKLKRGLV